MAPEPDPYAALLADLADEHAALDEVVRPLRAEEWGLATPSPGWSVRDQIGHLHHFDGTAHLSATDPTAFIAQRTQLLEHLTEAGIDDTTLAFARAVPPDELLAAWRQGRDALLAACATLGPKDRLEWYGPPMSAMSFVTARLMETWAHGQDVVDAIGGARRPTDRLRHVAHLGVRTRAFSYAIRGMDPPLGEVRVELAAPSGASWEWGPADAADRVRGAAVDFCFVVTQRRHRSETELQTVGPLATEWMAIAQAFAGGPSPGRSPKVG